MPNIPPTHRLRAHLKRGGIIAYPTEFCYGLGCHPRHAQALSRLLHLKKRPQHKGFIVIGDELTRLQPLLQPLPERDIAALKQTWRQAPSSIILPARHTVLPALRGRGRTQLAVRIPQHHLARQLSRRAQMPLVSTSCNKAGGKPCRTERQARRQFGRQAWIIGGRVGKARRASRIIHWQDQTQLR